MGVKLPCCEKCAGFLMVHLIVVSTFPPIFLEIGGGNLGVEPNDLQPTTFDFDTFLEWDIWCWCLPIFRLQTYLKCDGHTFNTVRVSFYSFGHLIISAKRLRPCNNKFFTNGCSSCCGDGLACWGINQILTGFSGRKGRCTFPTFCCWLPHYFKNKISKKRGDNMLIFNQKFESFNKR